MSGFVSLVGAGPGDPGLITARGLERLRAAEVVVYDRLAAPTLLTEAPAAARLIDVGKAPGQPSLSQDDINRLLVDEGRAGRRVVRLKGGDPFVFGRGGEEATALMSAGVAFEVVPGITSALAGPAAAGIPVTHRGLSTSVTIVTGHEDPAKSDVQTDWEALARSGGTLSILMGVGRLSEIVDSLLAGGRSPEEPAAAVTWATTTQQKVVRVRLADLPAAGVEPPAVVVVGPVAGLELVSPGTLAGRTVIVTRAREKASGLRRLLEARGAAVLEVPAIAFTQPSDAGALTVALQRLSEYDWVAFTSPTGAERALAGVRDARAFGPARVAAIGPGTAAALGAGGIAADLIPPEFVAESLAEAFPAGSGRVLVVRAEDAREVLPERLRAKGWDVDVVAAYRTVLGPGDGTARGALERGEVDAVTFTSSSTVRNFVALVGDVPRPPVIACIGPITARTATELGWVPSAVATEHTIDGLVATLDAAFAGAR